MAREHHEEPGPVPPEPYSTVRLVLYVLFAVAGWIGLTYGIYALVGVYRTNSWARTTAKFTQFEFAGIAARGGAVYKVRCSYTYSVNGVTYTGTKYWRTVWTELKEREAKEVAEKYKVGGVYEIAYDPADPSNALVLAGSDKLRTADYVFPTVMLLMALWCTYLTRQEARKRTLVATDED
jgi:hypothetical protein